jgi:Zn-dependent protease
LHHKKIRQNRKIRIPFYTVLFYALLILQNGGSNTAISLGSALLHELGHGSAALALGVEVERVTLYPFGADMILSARLRSYGTDAAIAAAGAAVNLLLALLGAVLRWPMLIACNLVLAFLNLLPIEGLDGGVLFLTLMHRHGIAGKTALKISSFFCLFFLWMAAVYILMVGEGDPSLFVLACGLFISVFLRRGANGG